MRQELRSQHHHIVPTRRRGLPLSVACTTGLFYLHQGTTSDEIIPSVAGYSIIALRAQEKNKRRTNSISSAAGAPTTSIHLASPKNRQRGGMEDLVVQPPNIASTSESNGDRTTTPRAALLQEQQEHGEKSNSREKAELPIAELAMMSCCDEEDNHENKAMILILTGDIDKT